MLLSELLDGAGLTHNQLSSRDDVPVSAVRYDSRLVRPGDLFVAVRGTATDGHEHIRAAIDAGAVCVVVEDAAYFSSEAACVKTDSTRAALADLAATLQGYPAAELRVTGITGTDGKTTSAFLLSHMLEALGTKTGLLSTVSFKIGDRWEENKLRQSTLEAPEIQQALSSMLDAGVSDAIVEATSHGLALERVRDCFFDDAIITNITSEHLEFHRTRERYVAAKQLILQALSHNTRKPWPKFAAINLDDEGTASLIPASPAKVVTFGMSDEADVHASRVEQSAAGTAFQIAAGGAEVRAFTLLPGLFNVSNCLGVIGLLYGRGIPLEVMAPHLASFMGVPGRMRRVELGQPFLVIVDYAHTAASLEKVLQTLRPLTAGKLIAVFGSAGDRDREKRPAMGRVAASLADYSVFTDEDPRWESPMAILEEIAAGARLAGAQAGQSFDLIPPRSEAIGHALGRAEAGDVVLLAGKGHEQSIIAQGVSRPWDDETAARHALRALGFGD
jgi:UDP-N-acetylmuramoyl-L-alanyl-D-glutamate--2,6-diaminopimelate ligase